MGTRRGRTRQATMWVPTADLPKSAGHPFYERLNRVLDEAGFDAFVEAQGEKMRERPIGIQELETNPSGWLEEVRSGTTLLLTDGGHRVARLIPEPRASDLKNEPAIAWSGRRLKKTKPKARLRGGGSMADIVKENRR